MWTSVIDRARMDLAGVNLYGADPDEVRAEVEAWIGTDEFKSVCDLAGVNPRHARSYIEGTEGASLG